MLSRTLWLFMLILPATAKADDTVSTTQVVAAQAAGAIASDGLGANMSIISQTGYGNSAHTDQLGTGDVARITQNGSDFTATILQMSQHDTAVVTQSGNGAGLQPVSITQTGPAQAVTITMHR